MISAELHEWLDENACHLLYDDYDEDSFDSPVPAGWSVKSVDHYGGEDQGSEYWTVWQFTNGNDSILIRVDGWYQSYNGAEYSGYREVTAKEKTIIVYE